MSQPTAAPITGRPSAAVGAQTGIASDDYKGAFGAFLRGRQGFSNVLDTGSVSTGEYLVPEEFERRIISGLDEANVVRGLANVICRTIAKAQQGKQVVFLGIDFHERQLFRYTTLAIASIPRD